MWRYSGTALAKQDAMPRELQARLLQRAIEIAGGPAALCLRIGCDDHAVELWLADRATVPDRVMVALVDLILEDDIARAAQDRRKETRSSQAELR